MFHDNELIDTLWNVNTKEYFGGLFGVFELIDTLWNVNQIISVEITVNPGINRYIMECKFF